MKSKNELDDTSADSLKADIENLGNIVNKIALEEEIIKIEFEFPDKLKRVVDENGDN